jgi:hypothetical protein
MSMNIGEQFKNMSLGAKIILIAGPLLLINSFLPWYHISVDFGFGEVSADFNAWEDPGAIWSMLATFIGVAMAIGVAVTHFTKVQTPDLPAGVTHPRIYLGFAIAAGLFILLKILDESSHMSYGFFLGIILVGALIAGAFLMFQEEQGGKPLMGGGGGGSSM